MNNNLLIFEITNTEYGQQLILLKVDYIANTITARLIFDQTNTVSTHEIMRTKKNREYIMFNRKQYYLETAISKDDIGSRSCFHPSWCDNLTTEVIGDGLLVH